MHLLLKSGRRLSLAAAALALVVGGGLAVAAATSHAPSNAVSSGRGIPEYGMTKAFFRGRSLQFTYSQGFYCDTSVPSHASSACEAGANFKTPPASDFDPLYITVPLGFAQPMNMVDCPANLVCVDHPGTIDLTRLTGALKPLYPSLSSHQLRAALRNFAVPAHDHYITTANHGQPEWWDVKIVGVTSAKTFDNIRAHKSFSYIKHLIDSKDSTVVGPIPTNLFLYFSVQ